MESYLKTHIFYVVLISVGLIAGSCWLKEHDARIQSDAQVKQDQQQVKDLQAQILAVNAAAQKQVQVIVKTVQAAKTPEQVIAAIPTLTDAPLNARPVPNSSVDLTVDSQALVQELGQCKENKVNLDACVDVGLHKDAIIADDEKTIKAIQKKPSFFARLKSGGKVAAAAIVIFEIARVVLGGKI